MNSNHNFYYHFSDTKRMDNVINVQEKLYEINPDSSWMRRLADLHTFKTTLR